NELSEQTPLMQLENVKIKKAGRNLEIFPATLFPGIVYQIQGPNGSGKSTLLDIFAHERKIDEGNIYFEGKSGSKKQYSGKFVKNATIYIRQDTRIYKQTPVATLNAAIRTKQLSSATAYRSVMGLLESYGLQEIANVKMKDLSSVTRKKIELLTVFLRDSRLVIIDDPAFESMDEHFVRKFLADLKKSVKQDNRTLVLAQAQSLLRYRVIDITLVMHKGHIIRVEKTYQKKSPARKPQNNKS
ncbi:MAG: ATP-binding cassette domain-containing protein, partial [bacterium]|nr:ATP-binding cassette domain-containing protein [bacterium]